MTKEELSEMRKQAIKSLNDVGAILGLDEMYIDDLEKENAELKEKLKPENCLKLLAKDGYVKFTSDKLTKAKEFLNEFMRISKASDEDFEHDYSELIVEAEQFLKDLEK